MRINLGLAFFASLTQFPPLLVWEWIKSNFVNKGHNIMKSVGRIGKVSQQQPDIKNLTDASLVCKQTLIVMSSKENVEKMRQILDVSMEKAEICCCRDKNKMPLCFFPRRLQSEKRSKNFQARVCRLTISLKKHFPDRYNVFQNLEDNNNATAHFEAGIYGKAWLNVSHNCVRSSMNQFLCLSRPSPMTLQLTR